MWETLAHEIPTLGKECRQTECPQTTRRVHVCAPPQFRSGTRGHSRASTTATLTTGSLAGCSRGKHICDQHQTALKVVAVLVSWRAWAEGKEACTTPGLETEAKHCFMSFLCQVTFQKWAPWLCKASKRSGLHLKRGAGLVLTLPWRVD